MSGNPGLKNRKHAHDARGMGMENKPTNKIISYEEARLDFMHRTIWKLVRFGLMIIGLVHVSLWIMGWFV